MARKGIVSSLAKRKPSSARAEKSVPGKHPPPKKRSRLRQGEPDGSQTPKAATRSASPSPEDAGAGLTVPLALKQTEDAIYVISRVFRAAADPIIIRDMDGTIIDLNAEAERAYGWKRDELIGQSIKQILPPEEHERVDDLVRRCRSGQSVRDVEILRWNKAGKRIPVLLTLSVIENEAGDAVAVATLAKHIVRLKEVENALRRSETRLRRTEKDLRALASELIQDREEENKRWARELHDVFSQTLAVLKMDVATLREQIPLTDRIVRNELEQLAARIGTLAKYTHEMSRRLHPSILHDLGLGEALKAECLTFSKRYGLPAKFKSRGTPESFSQDASLCLYRVAQECLQNVAKHADAKEVSVTLVGKSAEVSLSIADNGKGFDRSRVRRKARLGLLSMEERVRLLGGELSVRSKPGDGTQVRALLPLKKRKT